MQIFLKKLIKVLSKIYFLNKNRNDPFMKRHISFYIGFDKHKTLMKKFSSQNVFVIYRNVYNL